MKLHCRSVLLHSLTRESSALNTAPSPCPSANSAQSPLSLGFSVVVFFFLN